MARFISWQGPSPRCSIGQLSRIQSNSFTHRKTCYLRSAWAHTGSAPNWLARCYGKLTHLPNDSDHHGRGRHRGMDGNSSGYPGWKAANDAKCIVANGEQWKSSCDIDKEALFPNFISTNERSPAPGLSCNSFWSLTRRRRKEALPIIPKQTRAFANDAYTGRPRVCCSPAILISSSHGTDARANVQLVTTCLYLAQHLSFIESREVPFVVD